MARVGPSIKARATPADPISIAAVVSPVRGGPHMPGGRTPTAVLVALLAVFGGALALTGLSAEPSAAPATASFVVKGRHGHAQPARAGASHTAGGLTEVAQPSEDTLVIT